MRVSPIRKAEGGFALIGALIVMMLLMAIAGAMHVGVLSETSLRGAHAHATAGFYAAEAGINRGMGDYRNLFMGFGIPSQNAGDFDENVLTIGPRTVRYRLTPAAGNWPVVQPIPAGRTFAGLRSSLYRYVAVATSEVHPGDVEVSLGTQFDVNNVPLFQFLAFYNNDLEINPGPVMTLHGPIHTNGSLYFNSNNTLTIEDDPATGMNTVSVTAAGNVYRGRKDNQNSPKCGGIVNIDMLTDQTGGTDLEARPLDCDSSSAATNQTDAMLAPWLGAIRARQSVVAVPEPSALSVGGRYWDEADLRIALDLNYVDPGSQLHRIVALDKNLAIDEDQTTALRNFVVAVPGGLSYNDVPVLGGNADTNNRCTTSSPDSGTYCHPNSYLPVFDSAPNHMRMYACPWSSLNLYPGCTIMPYRTNSTGERVYRRGGFYNNREQAWVWMLNLNLHDLLEWNRGPGAEALFDPDETGTSGGNVIFMTVRGPNSTGTLPNDRRYGVRVFGSRNLAFPGPLPADPNGVTVISDQAIYVEGHYNVNTDAAVAGLYDPNFPKNPSAFMGDTINVLSSNWTGNPTDTTRWTSLGGVSGCRNDCQSRRTVTQRPGLATYINAAFLSSVDTTTSESNGYNGGLENYPRFHEDWRQPLNYRGSFVSLGVPQRANGKWCGTGATCNIYNAPGRNWDFDRDFLNAALLPPATPTVVSVEQILFTENFR
ncbi:MAG: hypothetical protein KIT14_20770 [bacterium]|nr:hypothetical protein [bacterium]